MSTRPVWYLFWVLIPLIEALPAWGSDEPSSDSLQVVVVDPCTVKFVNKSTYATARPGIIAELPFQEGDYVRAGDLVVRLRDEVAQAELKLREAQALIDSPLLVAQKEQQAADLEYQAALTANQKSATAFPKTAIERLQIISEARKLQVDQARDELKLAQLTKGQAEAELESYRVHAKFGGLVTRVHKHVGEAVNLGDEIITIVDTSRVRVEGTSPYADIRLLQVGDPVRIQLDLPEDRSLELERLTAVGAERAAPARPRLPEESEVFTGHIGFIDVETGSQLGLKNEIRIWAEVINRDNILLEGLPAIMKVQARGR